MHTYIYMIMVQKLKALIGKIVEKLHQTLSYKIIKIKSKAANSLELVYSQIECKARCIFHQGIIWKLECDGIMEGTNKITVRVSTHAHTSI